MKVAGGEVVNAVWRTWVCKGKMKHGVSSLLC
jgi:hypothetical protein